MNTGLVTIIMPFLNPRESFFREALESVEAQTYGSWELILIDDGSEASVSSLAREWAKEHPNRIRYIEHDGHQNLGISVSRNLGLTIARGEFIAFLDADDVWDEWQLEEQVALLQQQPNTPLLYGNTTYWRSWDRRAQSTNSDFEYKLGLQTDKRHEPPNVLKRVLQRRAISPCMTSVMARRSIFDDGIGFEDEFREHYEDQVFLAKVFVRFPVYVSGRCWGKYRQNPESTTGGNDHSLRAKKWRLRYLEWVGGHLREQGLEGSAVWRTLRLEMWMLRNKHVEQATEWLRLWKRRVLKAFGGVNA